MDLELKHLGQTIAIGGFTIYTISLLVRLYFPKWNINFLSLSQEKLQIQQAAVYLALVFAVGIVLEDVSSEISNKDLEISSNGDFYPKSLFKNILDSNKDLRLLNLFSIEEFSESRVVLKTKSISKETLKLGDLPEISKQESKETETTITTARKDTEKKTITQENIIPIETKQEIIKTNKQDNSPNSIKPYVNTLNTLLVNECKEDEYVIEGEKNVKLLRSSVNGIYYNAKNAIFKTETYFDELSEIQARIDFTRSLTLLCLIFSLVYFLAMLCSFIRHRRKIIKLLKHRKKIIELLKKENFKEVFQTKIFNVSIISILFLIGFWLSGTAYRSEFTNYNLRVFGYYISEQLSQK